MSTKARFRVGTLVATTHRVLGYDTPHLGKAPNLPPGTVVVVLEAKRCPHWRYRTRPPASVADAEYWVDEDLLDLPLLVKE